MASRFRRDPVVIACVYRAKNAEHVLAALQPMLSTADIRLWALDEVDPRLAAWTRGQGRGLRLALLNMLIADAPSDADTLLVDDDVAFGRGSLSRFVAVCRAARLDLAQPAHDPLGHWNHRVTVARRLSPVRIARLTTFVEVGPVVFISAALRPLVLPMPEEFGMGWGLDVIWTDLVKDGWRLGVVDATCLRHLGEVGKDYAADEEQGRLTELLSARGVVVTDQLAYNIGWWPVEPVHWIAHRLSPVYARLRTGS